MNGKFLLKNFGLWLILFLFFLLIGVAYGNAISYSLVLFVTVSALRLVIQMWPLTSIKSGRNKIITSPDGIVVATIEDWGHDSQTMYKGIVKRVYQDGVFTCEEEFNSLETADTWLTTTYQQELAKHERRIQQTE